MTEPIRCPNCNSPDTVSYWDLKENQEKQEKPNSVLYIYKSIYPDARKCVDCSLLWWTEGQRADIDFQRKREPHESVLMPCSPCPDCGHLHRLSKCGVCTCENKDWR